MTNTVSEFIEIKEMLNPIDDTAAALLVLAEAIRESGTFRTSNAENFGHELALALKNVLQESVIRVSRE